MIDIRDSDMKEMIRLYKEWMRYARVGDPTCWESESAWRDMADRLGEDKMSAFFELSVEYNKKFYAVLHKVKAPYAKARQWAEIERFSKDQREAISKLDKDGVLVLFNKWLDEDENKAESEAAHKREHDDIWDQVMVAVNRSRMRLVG